MLPSWEQLFEGFVMLISDDKALLFVHIQKTGGTSLTQYFQNNISDLILYQRHHSPISEAESKFLSYFKVAFVRNPYDRLVSWYHAIDRKRDRIESANYMQKQVLKRANSFKEFILNCEDVQSKVGWLPFKNNQLDYLTDKNGKVIVDFIGRFETYEESVKLLLHMLDMPVSDIPHINKTNHTRYQDYYDSQTKAIVAKRFERDLEFFKYRF